MLYSSPKQLSFPPVAGQTLRADFEGGALSSILVPSSCEASTARLG